MSLYKICLQRTISLTKTGIWKDCSTNPFSNLPGGIVDDVMLCLTSRRISQGEIYLRRIKLSDFLLLLTSGKLTHLHLNPFEFEEEYDLFLKIIRTNCCKNVRILTSFFPTYFSNLSLVETLISLCPNLEEFTANILLPNFEVFKNCKRLRILRFRKKFDSCSFSVDCSALAVLENLEVVSFADMDSDIAFKVLQHCPQLISIGNNDSLNALKKIHESQSKEHFSSTSDICGHFQLRRCIWGTNKAYNSKEPDKELSTFSEKLRIAISLCPLVMELVVCVHQGESIRELKNLKKLAILKIDFLRCVDDYLPNFIELLREIGHQLKFLFVVSAHPISVDSICECCPNLLILDIHGDATLSKPASTNHCLLLKKLRFTSADRKGLLFFLSNCKNLEELVMGNVPCLDDYLLDRVIKVNPLGELKDITILQSSLSIDGFRTLLQKTQSLQKMLISSKTFAMVKSLVDELNLRTLVKEIFFDLAYHARHQCGRIGLSHFKLH